MTKKHFESKTAPNQKAFLVKNHYESKLDLIEKHFWLKIITSQEPLLTKLEYTFIYIVKFSAKNFLFLGGIEKCVKS